MIPGLEKIEHPRCDAAGCDCTAYYMYLSRWFLCIDCQRNIGHDSVSLPRNGTVQEWAKKQAKLTDAR
jgi:hypothetical protein